MGISASVPPAKSIPACQGSSEAKSDMIWKACKRTEDQQKISALFLWNLGQDTNSDATLSPELAPCYYRCALSQYIYVLAAPLTSSLVSLIVWGCLSKPTLHMNRFRGIRKMVQTIPSLGDYRSQREVIGQKVCPPWVHVSIIVLSQFRFCPNLPCMQEKCISFIIITIHCGFNQSGFGFTLWLTTGCWGP